MIDGLRPYPEMKESGLPWLGDVPAHWEVFRSKYVFREMDRRSTTGAETHLSMSQRLGLVAADQVEQRTLVSESYVGGKLVEKDDLVLNRLKAHLGVFAHAKQAGVVSPDYTVLQPRADMNVHFFEYVLRSAACRTELRTRAKGIVEGFWRLYTDDFYAIRLPVPSLDEQRLIVRFLDWHGAQTAKLIRIKKQLIALLNEQKQSIIHRAVTRGLDPNVKLKPSGVPWLDDVPVGWEVRRNGRLFSPRRETGFPDLPILEVAIRTGVRVRNFDDGARKQQMTDRAKYQRAVRGDIAYNMMRMWQGAVGVVPVDGLISPAYVVARPLLETSAAYYIHLFRTAVYMREIDTFSRGIVSDRNRLYWESFKQMPSIWPPFDEQEAIVRMIDLQTADLNAALSATSGEISLVQEYRTRLIADVVTGKLDVRSVSAGLPDVADLEPIDEATEAEDLDEEAMDETHAEDVAA
jgi:type I restriction enzyme S subunit